MSLDGDNDSKNSAFSTSKDWCINPQIWQGIRILTYEDASKMKDKHIFEVKLILTLVNVKPYQYPHHQKIEMETLIQYLLMCRFISMSRSPYATPVVLVSKKYGAF